MKARLWLTMLVLLLALPPAPTARGAVSGDFLLQGRILNSAGQPVQGGEVFLYDSVQVRRPADFISARTEGSGEYRLVVPAGNYWAVARVRGAGFRPQMGVEQHSGEATPLEASPGGHQQLDFTVAEVRELAKSQRKAGSDFSRLEGRLLDQEGRPLSNAYAFAYALKERSPAQLPDYLSAWSDAGGSYTLYLPAGSYCLGGATAFPPEENAPCEKLILDPAKLGVAIDVRLKYLNGRDQETRSGEEIQDD